ncbi:MAG: dienelactone hydrolase family protein [Gemmatimonadota bacterium]
MTGTVRRIKVTRTARYYVLGERDGAVEVWFVLHGYSQLAGTFAKWFEPAVKPGRLIVAPEGLSRAYFEESGARRVGASWMTKEDREAEIVDYVGYLDDVADEVLGDLPPRPRLEVHGFSQGAATASRWAAMGRYSPNRLVLWGGTVPPDLELERLKRGLAENPIIIVVGNRDQFVPVAQVETEQVRLLDAGLHAEIRVFDGGHRVDERVLGEMA